MKRNGVSPFRFRTVQEEQVSMREVRPEEPFQGEKVDSRIDSNTVGYSRTQTEQDGAEPRSRGAMTRRTRVAKEAKKAKT